MSDDQGDEPATLTIYSLLSMFFMLACVMIILYIVFNYQVNTLYAPTGLEKELLSSRFFYSDSCFAYTDGSTMRTYPFVLEWDRFTEDNLNVCMSYGKGMRLTLSTEDKSRTIKTSNWNGEMQESLARDVIVFDGGLKRGRLEIDIG